MRRSLEQCGSFGAVTMVRAAALLSISRAQLARMIANGAILAVRVRGEKMVPKSELRRQLERRTRELH